MKKEYIFLRKYLNNPQNSIFHGPPKIHELFVYVPPICPIVYCFDYYINHLFEFIDSFLKFQDLK